MRSNRMKRWIIKEYDKNLVEKFMKEWGLNRFQAILLVLRGVKDIDSLRRFLYPEVRHLIHPYALKDMDKAIGRIKSAVIKKEKILIFGDYDVDGITSSCILKQTFQKVGIDSYVYIPSRINEGYGLNENIFAFLKKYQSNIVVCVDTGTSSHEIVLDLKRKGIDVIILDHHNILPGRSYPEALAFVNPKRGDSEYPFREISSAVLAFKLSWALLERIPFEFMDLVCLSVICDVCPLLDENRIFVKQGLKFLRATPRVGLRALMEEAHLSPENVNVYSVGYILGPRLNASGRLTTAYELSLIHI